MVCLCPQCSSELIAGENSWRCPGCQARYPALRGIPDLRTAEDAYLPNGEDWAIARVLDDSFDTLDFRGLLDLYFDLVGETSAKRRSRQIGHILSASDRSRRWVERLGSGVGDGPILDLGCGSGSFLATQGRRFETAVGIDIAMRWLIVARKRLDEEGMPDVPLICGCAEAMPFPPDSFSAIVGGDVIEHVNNQDATLREAYRVIRPGGRLILATPNRFSLAPEPHVGVWGVGFLPRDRMNSYVRITSNQDFRAIHTSGWSEWRARLERSPFEKTTIETPGIPGSERKMFRPVKRMLAGIYERMIGMPIGRAITLRVGPLFHIVAERSRDPKIRATSRATRPRSTPSATRP